MSAPDAVIALETLHIVARRRRPRESMPGIISILPSAHLLTTSASFESAISPIDDSSAMTSTFSSKSTLAFGIHIVGATAVPRVVSFQSPSSIFLPINLAI